MQHAEGRLQVLRDFTATGAMQHDALAGRGTLHGVIVNMFMPPNAGVRVSPGCACRVFPTVGRSAALFF